MAVSKFLDPKNDVAFRKIFGSEKNKDILIHFINDIMGFKDDDAIQEVTFLSTVQNPEIAYKKESVVDVLCEATNGTQIIVEMQVSPSKGFEKRAQYYASKAYSRQLAQGQGEDGLYANLKEVIFIAISDYNIFPKKAAYLSHHVILDKKTYENDLKDFSFSFIELPKFTLDKIEQLTTIVEKWCYFFKYAAKTSESDLKKIIGSDVVIERAYEALNQFNWTESELLTYEQEIKRVMDNRAAEAYALESAESRGEARGIEKGIEQRNEQIAINMLKEKAELHFISTVTGLTLDAILQLKNKL
jgi:predicted transposase/invertase (TIGR01784 family)